MYNPYLFVPIVVWAVTQFTKFVVASVRGQLDFRNLYASGGMPSVHSAVVTSLATTAFLVEGPSSPLFGFTAVFAGIVIYDSLGVRRSSGEQAKALNIVIESLSANRIALTKSQERVREVLGHKPNEVAVGISIGLILGALLNPSQLGPLVSVLTHPIGRRGIIALTALAVILLIGGFIARMIYLRRYHDIEPLRKVIRRSYLIAASTGIVGLILAFLAWQKIPLALWVIWPALLLAVILIVAVTKVVIYKDQIPGWLADRGEQAEKERWMEGPNKKRRAAKARSRKRR